MARRNIDFYSNQPYAQAMMWFEDHPLVPVAFHPDELPYPEAQLREIKEKVQDHHSKQLIPFLKGHVAYRDLKWISRIRPKVPQLGYAIDLVCDLPTDQLIQVIGAQLEALELCPSYVICRVNGKEVHRIKWPPEELERMALRVKRRREVRLDTSAEDRFAVQVIKDYLLKGEYPRRGVARGCPKAHLNAPHLGQIAILLNVPRKLVSLAVDELGDALTA